MMLHIILSATDQRLLHAWQDRCGALANVSIHNGSILDLECDAVVSPANSFGFMDGGIDLVYSQFFGVQIEQTLQQRINDQFAGELLVGQAVILPTTHRLIPYVIAAPTMRTPQRLDATTINPYLAARAVLLLWRDGRFTSGPHTGKLVRQHVSQIAFPGLGTGIGETDPQRCAQHVRVAIEDVLLTPRPFPRTWSDIQLHQQRLDA